MSWFRIRLGSLWPLLVTVASPPPRLASLWTHVAGGRRKDERRNGISESKRKQKRKTTRRVGVRGSAKGIPGAPKGGGRRAGRGPSEALESAEIGRSIRHALAPRSARRGRRIRMRLAARAPPPPILELGVCCSCLRSANCKISIRCLMSAFFGCVRLVHISADI